MIAAKDGLLLIAIIPERRMSEFLYKQVRALWLQCEQRGVEEEKQEREEGRNMKYEVCESCGAHLDHGEKCDGYTPKKDGDTAGGFAKQSAERQNEE